MPDTIVSYPHVVVIGSQVYIGGGTTRAVMVYDIYDDEMNELPPLDYKYYGMTAHNSQLVVVGGWHTTQLGRRQINFLFGTLSVVFGPTPTHP